MYGVMTERSVTFNTRTSPPSSSMSTSNTNNIAHQHHQTFECDSPPLVSITSSSNMPALLHNSKRKRLDQVLTKLSMSTCKPLLHSHYPKPYRASTGAECDDDPTDNISTFDKDALLSDSKLPQKQLSLDSEMSMTVENLKLDISESVSIQSSKSSTLECSSSTSSSTAMLSPTSTIYPYTGTMATSKCSTELSANSKAAEMAAFNTGSDLLATSISMSTLFTPPTSDSAGGTAEYDEEEEDEDHAKSDQHEEVTDTTTVLMNNTKCTLDSDNLFSSHKEGSKEQLLRKLPQAKLLSHDCAQKISENAHVPDVRPRTRMLKSLQSAESVSSSSSSSICASSYLGKLPYSLSSDTLPSFPICKCSHCRNLADQTSSKMPALSHSLHQHSLNSWCWLNFKHESQSYADPFSALVSPSLLVKHNKTALSESTRGKINKSYSQRSFHSSLLTDPNVDATSSSVTPHEYSKKRSHSDSDMVSDNPGLYTHEEHFTSSHTDNTLLHLQKTEPGVIVKNGRCVPKPLRKTALCRSNQSTPQESPLDLSVKSLSPNIKSASPHLYSDLITANAPQSVITNSSSVPLLSSSSYSPKQTRFVSPYNLLSPIVKSAKNFSDERKGQHVKRHNISISDSQYSSSVSSVSSLSPREKHSTDKTLKSFSPLYSIYQDESVKSNCQELQSCSSTVKCYKDETDSAISINLQSPVQSSEKSSSNCAEQKTQSLSSLNDLDFSSFSCPICGQTFSLHDRLAKHIASRHKNRQQCDSVAKNYLCEVCQRSFARSDMLTRHMRLHTGIKPYTCKICGQVFSRSDHLSTHQRTHTGEKPYKCPQCPYAACRRDMITRHMRTHSRYEIPDSSSSTEELSK